MDLKAFYFVMSIKSTDDKVAANTIFEILQLKKQICGLQLFELLALLNITICPADRAKFIFKVFDTDRRGTLSLDEVQSLCHTTAITLAAFTERKDAIDIARVLKTAAEAFAAADINKSNSITAQEFVCWGSTCKYELFFDTSVEMWSDDLIRKENEFRGVALVGPTFSLEDKILGKTFTKAPCNNIV